MPATVDLFWSFRSPYSYLATPEAMQLPKRFDIELRFRPVLPLAVRQPGFFSPENLKRAKYILIDWPRRAEMLGLPHAWPSPDPIVQDLKTYEIADEQPYIYRLTWLGVEAERRGRGVHFAAQVSRLIFGGTIDWHLGDRLAKAAARARLDLEQLDLAIAEPESHREEVERNQQDLEKAGHWGVPTFVFRGEPFFGQDRIDTLCWRLDREGLAF
ncbi:MAG: DsbA family protein [Woeseiaceae bacterium]|nr:DsbA family protein [Woeseiaceae bacterium]